jgi:hypothetical protein
MVRRSRCVGPKCTRAHLASFEPAVPLLVTKADPCAWRALPCTTVPMWCSRCSLPSAVAEPLQEKCVLCSTPLPNVQAHPYRTPLSFVHPPPSCGQHAWRGGPSLTDARHRTRCRCAKHAASDGVGRGVRGTVHRERRASVLELCVVEFIHVVPALFPGSCVFCTSHSTASFVLFFSSSFLRVQWTRACWCGHASISCVCVRKIGGPYADRNATLRWIAYQLFALLHVDAARRLQ